MSKRRTLVDKLRFFVTYAASSITVLVLLMIFGFVLITGKDSLSFDMIKNDYWSQNYLISVPQTKESYSIDYTLKENQAFSSHYGIVIEDQTNQDNESDLVVVDIVEKSPFKKSLNMTAGPTQNQQLLLTQSDVIERITLVDENGNTSRIGMIRETSAKNLTAAMDKSFAIESVYFQTPGGGIWGSLLATLKLIAISLSLTLPLGIFTAIYLNEVAKNHRITRLIERSIELLAGIPSIIFGLMGVIVLYPITTLVNIEGLSILLGGLTMAVILLPVVIRSVQESLKTVPQGLRQASLSLGASKTQTIFKVILPSSLSGILSGVLLAISRIIGESAALIYTMGTFINDSPKINEGATTLAVHIWTLMGQEQPNFELASAISIIILIMVLILNLSVKYVRKKIDRKLGT